MSLLIQGMEMPKPGQTVLAEIDENGDVFATYDGGRTKLSQYQAVPIPPHGRLGDLNELFKRMFVGTDGQCYPDKDVDGLDHVYTFRVIKHEILSAPTIIPAEEGKT